MPNKTLTINGNNFADLESFYSETDQVLTKDLDFKTGHNLDAFNDLLAGGFGVYEYDEQVSITWTNFLKSKSDLGPDLVNKLVEIIKSHDHIDFKIED